jgi:hypothetical protein
MPLGSSTAWFLVALVVLPCRWPVWLQRLLQTHLMVYSVAALRAVCQVRRLQTFIKAALIEVAMPRP